MTAWAAVGALIGVLNLIGSGMSLYERRLGPAAFNGVVGACCLFLAFTPQVPA